MSFLDHFKYLKLINDQRYSLDKPNAFLESEEQELILLGYSGTGKDLIKILS